MTETGQEQTVGIPKLTLLMHLRVLLWKRQSTPTTYARTYNYESC
jgi:hypothetical protein